MASLVGVFLALALGWVGIGLEDLQKFGFWIKESGPAETD